jgi:hypothetical protein
MKLLKIAALSYLVKTILLGIAWLMIPDLPHRAAGIVRQAWAHVSPAATAPAEVSAQAVVARPPSTLAPARH